MNYRWTSALQALGGAVLAVGAVGLAWLVIPERSVERWREAATDRLLVQSAAPSGQVVVVDIDEASLDAVGPWPWPRTRLAELLGRIANGVPRVVGVDIVLAGEDRYAPRRLIEGLVPTDAAVQNLLAVLPDTDADLGAAVSAAPTVLAALFSDRPANPDPAAPAATLASVPVLMTGTMPKLAPWAAAGAITPLASIAGKTAGIGIASLAGDYDGLVRQAPLMGAADAAIVPGLAAEVLRHSQAASAFILDGTRSLLSIGDYSVPLTPDLGMRLRPSLPQSWSARTVSAATVLAGAVPTSRFEGKIVLVGGSAPSLGALRATAATPLAPSVQIQADAVETLLSRQIPYRPGWALPLEIVAFIALAAIGALTGALLGAATAGSITLAAAGLWAGGGLMALATRSLVIDPVTPALGAIVAVMAAGLVSAVMQRRLAASIRRRFEQHLAPAVVARIVDRPDIVRFKGERREITALFTDIEGFTSLTDRLEAMTLIALLDDYFAGVVEAVVKNGGMVDKIVGDAVHALFNAPVELEDHPRQALAAARDILAFTNAFMDSEPARRAGLGRTRIGLETGEAVIGDVGKGTKVDYTAHGSAVNTAARLEALNKQFGTSICVGPILRACLADVAFRPLGAVDVCGRGTMEVFTPAGN